MFNLYKGNSEYSYIQQTPQRTGLSYTEGVYSGHSQQIQIDSCCIVTANTCEFGFIHESPLHPIESSYADPLIIQYLVKRYSIYLDSESGGVVTTTPNLDDYKSKAIGFMITGVIVSDTSRCSEDFLVALGSEPVLHWVSDQLLEHQLPNKIDCPKELNYLLNLTDNNVPDIEVLNFKYQDDTIHIDKLSCSRGFDGVIYKGEAYQGDLIHLSPISAELEEVYLPIKSCTSHENSYPVEADLYNINETFSIPTVGAIRFAKAAGYTHIVEDLLGRFMFNVYNKKCPISDTIYYFRDILETLTYPKNPSHDRIEELLCDEDINTCSLNYLGKMLSYTAVNEYNYIFPTTLSERISIFEMMIKLRLPIALMDLSEIVPKHRKFFYCCVAENTSIAFNALLSKSFLKDCTDVDIPGTLENLMVNRKSLSKDLLSWIDNIYACNVPGEFKQVEHHNVYYRFPDGYIGDIIVSYLPEFYTATLYFNPLCCHSLFYALIGRSLCKEDISEFVNLRFIKTISSEHSDSFKPSTPNHFESYMIPENLRNLKLLAEDCLKVSHRWESYSCNIMENKVSGIRKQLWLPKDYVARLKRGIYKKSDYVLYSSDAVWNIRAALFEENHGNSQRAGVLGFETSSVDSDTTLCNLNAYNPIEVYILTRDIATNQIVFPLMGTYKGIFHMDQEPQLGESNSEMNRLEPSIHKIDIPTELIKGYQYDEVYMDSHKVLRGGEVDNG